MSKWFDANGTDVDAYPQDAFRGGVYERRRRDVANPGPYPVGATHDRAGEVCPSRGDTPLHAVSECAAPSCSDVLPAAQGGGVAEETRTRCATPPIRVGSQKSWGGVRGRHLTPPSDWAILTCPKNKPGRRG